ncbi:hypothetical protein [Acidithiobacillus albertensis]|uniref:hypothetical protein n=1 Tax=Acidithiobacillus albertensis TaxID=119978 RepID=UPI001C07A5AF|nr:hypothetical protein [Acidithiobacillus albertensis]MBU2741261.1 hypothetical protein [Acidithiobacillus albertensis]
MKNRDKVEAFKSLLITMARLNAPLTGGSIFAINGKTMITSLMMGLGDLCDLNKVSLTWATVMEYIHPDKFVELAGRADISMKAREAMQSFLMSTGWKEGVSDHSKWGDFDRQYSYAQNYFLEMLSVLSKDTLTDDDRLMFAKCTGIPELAMAYGILFTLQAMGRADSDSVDWPKMTIFIDRAHAESRKELIAA